ncbi:MAG: T9SS type A sorting domain-containing protein, partial [Bacteroidota bacterium]|nr:T9SS type A sorting domain-containing protein [Bacteroidota bacterium]
LRWAINQSGARIVLFKVAGVIPLTNKLQISNGDLTIAGQSAPGDGICLKNYPVLVSANNVIIRFMRFRMGDEAAAVNPTFGWDGADAIWGRNLSNVILDHCSMSWSIDECASFYDNKNFTMQWCILSESLRYSFHTKVSHGYGGIWGGAPASFHHNLLACHDSRNPRFCGSQNTNNPSIEMVDFRNNVIYNWGNNSGYGGEGGSHNIINNYYRSGPATRVGEVSYRIFSPWPDDGSSSQPAGVWGVFHLSGNVMKNSPFVTADNWLGFQPYYLGTKPLSELQSFTPFPMAFVSTQSAEDAYVSVTSYAGASLIRDAVDSRIIDNVLNGTISCSAGSNGSTGGLIDSQSDVGGWPAYNFNPEDVPTDTDNDGMPDSWETAHGLDPNNPADGPLISSGESYTNVEVYLNELVKQITDAQTANSSGIVNSTVNSLRIYPNPVTDGDIICIVSDAPIQRVQIFSIEGLKVRELNIPENVSSIPARGFNAGVYVIVVTMQNGSIIQKMIIKE